MTLYEKILILYPELKSKDFFPGIGTIVLQDDSDGKGPYILSWNHPTFPAPTADQLDTLEANP
jgi:hypothetical protein